jgi:hypothetical protein
MTTADDDLLAPLLAAAGVADGPVGVAELTALWETVGIADDALRDEFIDTVAGLSAADMESVQNADPELHLRLGHWKIDLARQGIRAGIISAIAAAVLVHQVSRSSVSRLPRCAACRVRRRANRTVPG